MKTKTTLTSILALAAIAATVSAENPYMEPDGSYVSLSGTVTSATPDSFILDYGEGLVTVEMDDWDWYADGYGIMENDDVTVYGFVDDDFYETTTVEASSVFVEDVDTYFYASGADEESARMITSTYYDYDLVVTGTVTSTDGREFTIDTGDRMTTVDTWQLGYNPLDDEGYLKLDKGDRVTVYGDLDYDVFDGREISAEALVELQADEGKGNAGS